MNQQPGNATSEARELLADACGTELVYTHCTVDEALAAIQAALAQRDDAYRAGKRDAERERLRMALDDCRELAIRDSMSADESCARIAEVCSRALALPPAQTEGAE
jgi:hypothetical protein